MRRRTERNVRKGRFADMSTERDTPPPLAHGRQVTNEERHASSESRGTSAPTLLGMLEAKIRQSLWLSDDYLEK
jgi:hypothetical protein